MIGAGVRLALAATVATLGCWAWATPAGAFVYWTTDTAIGRANLDGTGAAPAFIAQDFPRGLAIDDRYIYWSDDTTDAIGRANLDGSGANSSFIAGVAGTLGLAVDDRHIYWASPGNTAQPNDDAIGRANLDGSGVDPRFITATPHVRGLAVDDRHIYWSVATGTIGRANLDGSGVEPDFIGGGSTPIAVAVGDRQIYWGNLFTGTIGRANLDGSNVDQDFIGSVNGVAGVAVDDRYLYWVEFGSDMLGRARLDGTAIDRTFVATGGSGPSGLAVDGGPPGSASASALRVAFGVQQLGSFGTPRPATITNTGHGELEIDTARIEGTAADDFLVSYDACSRRTLGLGDSCTIRVRFGPSAGGTRRATLAVASNDPAAPLRIALEGTAGPLPQGSAGATGPIGATGATGATGASPPIATPGPPLRQARRGRVHVVTCRTVKARVRGHRVERRRCRTRRIRGRVTVRGNRRARATLKHRGRRYATGTLRCRRLVLNARRRVRAGRYTLTLRYRRITTRQRLTIGPRRRGSGW